MKTKKGFIWFNNKDGSKTKMKVTKIITEPKKIKLKKKRKVNKNEYQKN